MEGVGCEMGDEREEGAPGNGVEVEVMGEEGAESKSCGVPGVDEGGLDIARGWRSLGRCEFNGRVCDLFPFHEAEDLTDVLWSVLRVDGENVTWGVGVESVCGKH